MTAPLFGQAPVAAKSPTYYKDVLPVLQQHCQECHRKGEAAPFAMTTYAETRPWAKAIRGAVLTGKMPPWFADAPHGVFSKDRRMSQAAIDTVRAWVDAGAPEGGAPEAPAPATFIQAGGSADRIWFSRCPKHSRLPASGEIAWQYFPVHTGFTEDRWVRAVEVRPGNSAIVHDIRVIARPSGSKAFMEIDKTSARERQHPAKPPVDNGSGILPGIDADLTEIAAYVSGGDPVDLPAGNAMLLKAGSDLVFEVHYAANGKAQSDRSRVGLIFSPEAPKTRVAELGLANLNLRIPAGAPNHRIDTTYTLKKPLTVLSVRPHMHLRGKALLLRAVYPSSESEVLLNVPRYDFNWQMSYVLSRPRLLPAGTRLESAVYFDNSANNPSNPDPSVDVYWGDQTWEEMNVAFLRVTLRPDAK